MCGIAGIAGEACQDRPGSAESYLQRMAETLQHRGPDDSGIWLESPATAGVAHRRLSIVDLTTTGHQPMLSRNKRYVIVFNGEIYNHLELRKEVEDHWRKGSCENYKWRGRSDTETLLEAISELGIHHTLERSIGMFAFAVWDRQEHKLTLVRDRAGEKPIFYMSGIRFFAFASEVKALLVLPEVTRRLDPESLVAYLTYGYVPGTHSMFKGIYKLLPASLLEYNVLTGTIRTATYWEPPVITAEGMLGAQHTLEDLTDELQHLLEMSVRGQLQADVPVAVLLSGGVDSSLVAAVAARTCGRIRTFTIGFPSSKAHDERKHARLVADFCESDHVEIPLGSTSLDLVSRLARSLDEPLCDSSILPTFLISETVRKHVTVALGGDGGDELFGGYRAYNIARIQAALRKTTPMFLRRFAASGCRKMLPLGFKGRAYLAAMDGNSVEAAARSVMLFDQGARARLLPVDFLSRGFRAELLKETTVPSGLSIIQTATLMDFRTYLPDDLLVKIDRASMLCSLEVRAPFLDHRIIEFAFGSVPDCFKVGLTARKILLRALARRILPPGFDLRRKQGFSIPLRSWLKNGASEILNQAVELLPVDLVNPEYVRRLFADQSRGLENSERIFCLALLSHWLRNFQVLL